VAGALVLVTGASLFETLMLNLLTADRYERAVPTLDQKRNVPAWEQPEAAKIERRPPYGYVDLLTVQARRVLLFPEPTERGLRVTGAIVAGGVDLVHPEPNGELWESCRDPHFAWRDTKLGWLPVGIDTRRALFRDATALLSLPRPEPRPEPEVTDKRKRPKRAPFVEETPRAVVQLVELLGRGIVPPDRAWGLSAFGIDTDKAKVLLTSHDHLALPGALLGDVEKRKALGLWIALAERVLEVLVRGLRSLATHALAPAYDPVASIGRQPDGEEVTRWIDGRGVAGYWYGVEGAFRKLLVELGTGGRPAWRLLGAELRSLAVEILRGAGQILVTNGRGRLVRARVLRSVSYWLGEVLAELLPADFGPDATADEERSDPAREAREKARKLRREMFAHHRDLVRQGERGDLAALRAGLQRRAGSAADVLAHIAPFTEDLPVGSSAESARILAAELHAAYPMRDADGVSLGRALGRLSTRLSVEPRFAAFLMAGREDLELRVRELVRLAASSGSGLDWPLFAEHLEAWGSPSEWVQDALAHDFVGSAQDPNQAPGDA
jgi:CRISPR type I-E-associated protein CasB/Cse2